MTTTNEILQAYAPIGVDVVKKALEEVRASGKTIESVRSEVSKKDKVDRLWSLSEPFFKELLRVGVDLAFQSPAALPLNVLQSVLER